jgi:uncharacterized membrane protein YfcA
MQALLARAWSERMDTSLDPVLFIILFLAATFVAALVAGVAGFAFGLVVAAIWLYLLTPLQTATLIICFGLIVQGYSVWTLRRALLWRQIAPMVVGAAIGVPLGVAILAGANPQHLRIAVGTLLVLYSLYGLWRPVMAPFAAGGMSADVGAGIVNGVVGGATGLAGIVATVWCQLRGGPKDRQRAVFQPVTVATFLMSAAWLGGQGALSRDLAWLFVLGLPVLLAGTWAGLKLYGKLDESQFRRVVLLLLLVSGAVLLLR